MSSTQSEPTQVVVLRDRAGTFYTMPLETFEACRVPEERARELEKRLGEDVRGFASGDPFSLQNMLWMHMMGYQSDRPNDPGYVGSGANTPVFQ